LDLCCSWLYCTHLPLTTVGVCVDPVGVGQVYVGGVDENVHVKPALVLPARILPGMFSQSRRKASNCGPVVPAGNDAVHVSSVGVAVMPPSLGGTHVAVGSVGGASVTVVLPQDR
jgi:hypothetical protein